MTNLANLPPQPKPQKAKPNPSYLRNVRALRCVICFRQPCEAHHPIYRRFSQARVPDEMAIPLCPSCHAELHRDKKAWFAKYGPDTDFVAATQDALAHLLRRDT
jgi:NAD-dependent SIR2 family protein deacetylase